MDDVTDPQTPGRVWTARRGSSGRRGPRRVAVPAALIALAAAVTACGSSTSSSTAGSTATAIVIEFDGRVIAGSLDGSATSASLLAQLPLELSFGDHAGQEKLARLPAPLSLDGAPASSPAAPLTIGYYAPDQVLVLYYEPVGSFSGIVPLGTFDDLAAVRDRDGDFTATLRTAG